MPSSLAGVVVVCHAGFDQLGVDRIFLLNVYYHRLPADEGRECAGAGPHARRAPCDAGGDAVTTRDGRYKKAPPFNLFPGILYRSTIHAEVIKQSPCPTALWDRQTSM